MDEGQMTPDVLATVPPETARMYQCVPLALFGDTVQIAVADPLNPAAVDEMALTLKHQVQLVVANPAEVTKAVEKFYPALAGGGYADLIKELGGDDGVGESDEPRAGLLKLDDAVSDAPIVKFVNLVLMQAVQDRASDIHFEPFEDEFKIRYRVDGALYEMTPPPRHLAGPVTSRLKVMANLNISERRLPQDGRISVNIAGKQVDLRVSTLPTAFGESVVLRVLDRSSVNLEIESLGLPKIVNDYVLEAINQPNGIFVVTGPTGCGKTTTLYSCLRRVNAIDTKLLTVEDPVEFDIEGIMQVQVNEGAGLTFMKALRAFLRQDPDIIMLGEIRDLETAQIAIQASLTGH
ncbi:MAG: GspE/PulE family protein, partial [Actinomycetota bacterium]